jgi:hypothetical protein
MLLRQYTHIASVQNDIYLNYNIIQSVSHSGFRSGFHITENTLHLHYKDLFVVAVREIIAVSSNEHIILLCRHNAEVCVPKRLLHANVALL